MKNITLEKDKIAKKENIHETEELEAKDISI